MVSFTPDQESIDLGNAIAQALRDEQIHTMTFPLPLAVGQTSVVPEVFVTIGEKPDQADLDAIAAYPGAP
jgi:hypothetical protein